jgi:predicted MFS family arabinose efflux permease
MPLGGFLGGALGTAVGLRTTLWVAGIGGTLAFLWVLASPVPRIRVIPDQVEDQRPVTTIA